MNRKVAKATRYITKNKYTLRIHQVHTKYQSNFTHWQVSRRMYHVHYIQTKIGCSIKNVWATTQIFWYVFAVQYTKQLYWWLSNNGKNNRYNTLPQNGKWIRKRNTGVQAAWENKKKCKSNNGLWEFVRKKNLKTYFSNVWASCRWPKLSRNDKTSGQGFSSKAFWR